MPVTDRDLAVMLPRLGHLLTDAHEIAIELPDTPVVDALCRAIDRSITDVQVLLSLYRARKFTTEQIPI
jgi:hypothetical protein